MAKKSSGDNINLDGTLNLTVVLDNLKNVQEQIKGLQENVKVASKQKSKSAKQVKGSAPRTVAEEQDYVLKAIKSELSAARSSISGATKVVDKLSKEGKDLSNLNQADSKAVTSAVGGLVNSANSLRKANDLAAKVLGDSNENTEASRNLAAARNDSAALLNKINKELNKSFPEQAKIARAEIAKREAIQRETKQRNDSVKAEKARAKRETQAQRKSAADNILSRPQGTELTAADRAKLKASFQGQQSLAQSRLDIAKGTKKADGSSVSPAAIARLTAERDKATVALKAYNKVEQDLLDLQKEAKKADLDKTDQFKKRQVEAKADEDAAKAKAAADFKAASVDTKSKADQRKKEEASQLQATRATTKAEEKQRRKKAADEENARRKETAKEIKQFDSDQEYMRKRHLAAIMEDRNRIKKRAEFSRRVEEETAANLDKARTKALKEEAAAEKRRAAAELKTANSRKARVEETAKIQDKARDKAIAAEKANQDRLDKQANALKAPRAVATDVAAKYNAASPEDVTLSRVSREDIGALKTYAAAKEKASRDNLNYARSNGVVGEELKKVEDAHKRNVDGLRKVADAHRNLNHPLAQAQLLMRQFLRFAIGYGALYEVLGAVTALGRGILDLDESLKSIQAVSGATVSQMGEMEIAIKRVAVTTKFGVAEIAKATEILAQAGTSVGDIPAALRAVADFAAGTASSLEVAADLITTTKEIFEDLDYQTLADQLTKSVNISKLNADDLKTILSLSAQTAESYNLTSEQYLSAVTTLRNAGIKASTVATGLRQAMIEVFSPSTKAIKIITQRYRELGDNITEEVVRQRFFGFSKDDNPLIAVLSELKRIGFADEAQKELGRAFNVRATNVLIPLINNLEEVAAAEAKITFGTAAANAAEIQMESLRASIKNLGAAFTVLGDTIIGDGVGTLQQYADKITEVILKLTELDTALKLQGKEGLSSGLLPGLAGAAGGALLGRGVIGKTLLAGAGGAAGGYLGSGATGGDDSQTAEAISLGVLGVGAAASLVPIAGKLAAGFTKTAIDKAEQQTAKSMAGFIAKWSTKFLGARALGAAALTWVNPLVGLIVNGGLLAYAAYSFFKDPPDGVEAASNAAKGAIANLESNKAKLAELESQSDQFDVEKAELGDIEGKAANSVVNYRDKFDEANSSIQQVFGLLVDEDLKKLKALLVDYSRAVGSRRKVIAAQIEDLSPTGLSGEEFDRVVSTIANLVLTTEDAGTALADEFESMLFAAQERIEAAIADGQELTGGTLERDVKISSIFAKNQQFRDLISGRIDETSENYGEVLAALSQAIADINDDAIEAGKITKLADQKLKAKNLIKKALESSSATRALTLESLMNSLINNGILAGNETEEYLTLLNEAIAETVKELQEKFDRTAEFVKSGSTGNSRQGLAVGDAVNLLAETQEQINTLNSIDAENTVAIQEAKDAELKLRKDALAADQASLEEFYKLLRNPATRNAAKGYIEEKGGVFNEALRKVIEAPEGAVDQALAELKELVGDLDLENYEKTPDGKKARLKAGLNEVKGVVKVAKDSIATSAEAEQADKELADLKKEIVPPELIAQKAAIESEIARSTGSDLSNRANTAPLIQSLAALDAQIAEYGIVRIRNQMARIQAEADAGTGKLDVPQQRQYSELEGQLAKALGDKGRIQVDAENEIKKIVQDTERDRIKKAKEVAKLNIDAANRQIELSGATSDPALFNEAIQKINENRAKLRAEIDKELVIEGFQEGTDLYQQEKEAREIILRDITENAAEFISAVEKLSSGLEQLADIIEKTPVTQGLEQDALSERAGTVGDARRRQEVVSQSAAQLLRRQAATGELAEYEKQKQEGSFSKPEEAKQINNQILKTQNEIYALDQSLASLEITARENSAIATVRGEEEIRQLLSTEQMIEAIQDSDYAFKNFAENLRGIFLDAIDGMADAIATAVIEGGNFQELMVNLFQQIAQDMLSSGLKTLFNEVILQSLPAAAAGGIGKVLGVGAEAATDVATEAATEAAKTATLATTITAALTPAVIPLSAAGTALFSAAGLLVTAATAMGTAGVASGAGSSIASGLGGLFGGAARMGGIFSRAGIKRYAKGSAGIISGPGTGTSDSIPAFHIDGKTVRPIAVSNGESILTEKATDFLGEKFILGINSGTMKGFSGGAVMGRQQQISAAAKPSSVTGGSKTPLVTNKNSTTIVNAIDSSSVVAAGLETHEGSRAIMNYMRANKSQLRRILS